MTAHTIAHELQQTLDTYFDALTAAGKACPPPGPRQAVPVQRLAEGGGRRALPRRAARAAR